MSEERFNRFTKQNRPGNPGKLDEKTKKRLLGAIQMGATYDLACQTAGISYRTFRNWQLRGAEAIKKGWQSKDRIYREFVEDLLQAEGDGVVVNLQRINQAAGDGAWQAAAWLLERRYPDKYGRTVTENRHTGPDGTGPVQVEGKAKIDLSGLSDEELEIMEKALGKVAGE